MQNWARRFVGRRIELGWFGAIVLAVLCVLVSTLARLLLGGLTGTTLTFATYFPAVLVSALFGGVFAGFLSIALSIVTVWWAFTTPHYQFQPLTLVNAANFLLFALSSLVIVWLAVANKRLIAALEQKERQRKLLVGELEHRARNVLTLVIALIQQTVKQPDIAQTLIERIKVVGVDENILDEADGKAMPLRDLIEDALLQSHGANRFVLEGPDATISGAQAKGLRLVFHEMSTNARKYGALSDDNGVIEISWLVGDVAMTIVWRELRGPKVRPPKKHNFGSRLINRVIEQLHATLEPTFAETGYCYKIVLPRQDKRSA